MTPENYYSGLVERHKAYNWAAPMPYDRWLELWWPTILKGLNNVTL